MAMPDDLPAYRDWALLLLGYAGAFRRSEFVALDVEDLRFSPSGLYVWIAAAKNDPRADRFADVSYVIPPALTHVLAPHSSRA
jgi:integrase